MKKALAAVLSAVILVSGAVISPAAISRENTLQEGTEQLFINELEMYGLSQQEAASEPTQPVTAPETEQTNPTEPTQPTTVKLNTNSILWQVGKKGYFRPVVSNGAAVKYESSNPSVASVDKNGYLKALKKGSTTIKCSALDGSAAYDLCSVTVYEPVKSLVLNTHSLNWKAGRQASFKPTLTPADTPKKLITYSSSNKTVATVDNNGKITAVGTGSAVITCKVKGTKLQDTCKITVTETVKSFKLNTYKINWTVGRQGTFKPTANVKTANNEYIWKSDNTAVAKVDQNGKLTAVGVGSTVITCTSKYNAGLVKKCSVTVKAAPKKVESITLNTYSINWKPGRTGKFKATVAPSDADNTAVGWKSSDSKVAKVDQNGKLTTMGAGSAVITCYAKDGSGAEAQCRVTVTNYTNRIVDYSKAYTTSRVISDCKELAKRYPDLIKAYSIGKSTKGKTIPMLTLGTGSQKALAAAGIHSRENLSISFTMTCVEEYAKAYYTQSGKYGEYDMRDLLSKYTLYVVPVINPDGLDIFTNNENVLYSYPNLNSQRAEFKSNANGVNLNRNFPCAWSKITNGGISTRTTTDQKYKGPSAGSEQETKIMMALCRKYNFNWMFSMHLRGNVVYWRDTLSGTVPGDYALASKLQNKCGYSLMPTSTDDNDYGGGFENWFRQEFNRPGFCVELVSSNVPSPTDINSYNRSFKYATNWNKTRFTFIQGMLR
ncbi:MAG: Ig-like domain-containing protein [Acutalibacteraceae bacterium]